MIFLFLALLVLYALLTWRSLETGILLICALLPSYLLRFPLFHVPTTLLEGMLLILFAIWIWRAKKTALHTARLPKSFVLPVFFFLFASIVALIVSKDTQAAIGVWKAFYVEPIIFFFLLTHVFSTQTTRERDVFLQRLFQSLGLGALLVSVFGLVQYVFPASIPAPWDLERRITSIFEYPNALALFLEPIIVLSWIQLRNLVSQTKKQTAHMVFWIVVSVLSTINIVLAQSEAGIAALLVTGACFLLCTVRAKKRLLALFIMITATLFLLPVSREYLLQKIAFKDASQHVRLTQWGETTALLQDHPFFGVGLSGYPIALKPYHQALQYEIFQYPHTILFNIWVELGLLGVIASLWLSVSALLVWFKERTTNSSVLFIFFPFIFLEIFIHGLVDVPYFKNDLALLTWILLGCFFALAHSKNRAPHTSQPT